MKTHKLGWLLLAFGTCTAAQAQSSVQIYGTMDAYMGRMQTRTAEGSTHTLQLNSGGLTTSFIGFRGQEDLGGGLKALFALESYLRLDTGAIGRNDNDPFWGRLSIVGMESPWGRLTVGRHVTPYSLAATQNTPFAGTTTVSPVFQHVYIQNVAGGTRANNSVRYTSPSFSGFSAEVLYGLGREGAAEDPNRKRDRMLELVSSYSAGPLKLTAGHHRINLQNNGDGHDQTAWMVAAVYDFGRFKLNGQHHRVREDFNASASNARRHTSEFGVSVPVGAGSLLASYALTSIDDRAASTPERRRGFALGYDHYLSKRTDLYTVYYRDQQRDPDVRQTTLAAGIRHRF